MQLIKKYTILSYLLCCCLCPVAQTRDVAYYISAAITNSPLLNDYRNQLLLNTIDSQVLAASKKITIAGNGNSYYAPVLNGFGYDEAITNGAQLQALATATKNLLPKKFTALQYRDLQITADSLRIASRISEQDLRRSVISQYITVFGYQLQLEFNAGINELLNKEEAGLKKLTQKNVYKQVDYLAFLVTLQQQVLTGQQLEVQYKNDFATLNYLCGLTDTTIVRLASPDTSVVLNYKKEELPYFLKFKTDSLRLINNRALVNVSYRPHINLFADAGYQSSLAFLPYRNFGTSFGINFVVPIYDGHQKKLQYSKISIAERTRVRNQQFFEVQYNQQILQLQQQLAGIEKLLVPVNTQIRYIKALVDANGRLLQTGDIRITDYVAAINNLIIAENLVTQNRISRYQVIGQLNYWNR